MPSGEELQLYEMGGPYILERKYFNNIVLPRFITEYGREPLNKAELFTFNEKCAKRIMQERTDIE